MNLFVNQLVGFCLLLSCLAGLSYLLIRFLKVPSCIAPPAVVGLVIGVLFLADFVHVMKLSSQILLVLGLAGAICAVINFCRERQRLDFRAWANHKSLLWALVLGAYVCLYLKNSGRVFYQWDEFSHWGSVIRAIYTANTFHFNPNPLYFQDYPPGTALFSYFVLSIMGYSEGGAVFSYSIMLLAYCIPLLGLAAARGRLFLLIVFVVSLVLIRKLGHGWNTVLIDHVLSVTFAGLVTAYLLIRENNSARWPLALLFVTIALAKHAGVSMGLAACGLMVMDSIVIALGTTRQGQSLRARCLSVTTAIWPWVLAILPSLILVMLWGWYVEVSGASRGYGRFGIVELLAQGLGCCSTEREVTVVTKFSDHFFQLVGYSPVLLTVCFVGIGFFSALRANTAVLRQRQIMALLVMTGTGLFFTLVQLLFYLYAFNEYEALAIASFDRFLNTYYLAWVLSSLGWLVISWPKETCRVEKANDGWRHKLLLCVAVMAALLLGLRIFSVNKIDDEFRAQRQEIREWVNSVPIPRGINSSTYIVWQGSNGFEFWQTFYETLPRVTNKVCYSLGPKRYSDDIWTCPYNESQLRVELAGFDYVLIASGYGDLQAIYPNLFPNLGVGVKRAVMHVEKRDGVVYLSPLQ